MKGVKFFSFMLGVALLFSMSFFGCEEVELSTCVVEYISGYEITGTMESQVFTHGVPQNLRPNAFKREGYKFSGWEYRYAGGASGQLADGQEFAIYDRRFMSNKEYEAVIRGEIDHLFMNHDENGSVYPLELVANWEVDESYTGGEGSESGESEDPVTYTVTFNKNNSSATGSMNPQTFTSGKAQALTANGFSYTGHNFKGWSKTSDGSVVYSDKESIQVDSAMTLYAVWAAKKFNVTFDKNTSEATGTMSPQTFTYGIKQNISSNGFTRTGYNFKGWSKNPGGSVVYSDKESIQVDSAMILYAVWEAKKFTISFNRSTSEATGTMSPQTFTYGIKQNISSNGFTRTGYNFKGWAKSASGSVVYSDKQYIGIDSDMTLYAVWELVAVTSVSLNKTSLCLDSKTPETFQLTATVYPANAFQSVTWKSSDTSVATVSNTGLVTAKGSGWKSATITCTSSYGGKTASCTVEAYKSPTINGNEMSAGDYYSKGGIFKRTIERKFWLSTYETSKDEYEKYCCYLVDPFKENWGWKSTTPAFGMTWLDAIVYCNLKSKAEGLSLCYSLNGETDVTKWEGINSRGSGSSKRYCGASNYKYYPTWYAQIECDFSLNGYRLPTEAEWEAFARHGYDKNSDCYIGGFPLGYTNLGDCMNFNAGEREPGKYTLIKPRAMMYRRHAFYDLGGNVAEWCWDRGNHSSYRVVKGGDACSGADELLASTYSTGGYYTGFHDSSLDRWVGIRLCRTVTN